MYDIVPGPLCFLICVNNITSVVSRAIKLLAGDTKLHGEVTSVENIEPLQRDDDEIAKWTSAYCQFPLKTSKCRTVHLDHRHPRHTYHVTGCMVDGVTNGNDLGIMIDEKLAFHNQTNGSGEEESKHYYDDYSKVL